MFDLYIDPATGDLAYQNGGLLLIKDTNKRVRQELETTLRAFRGEWFNNVQFGGINRDYIGRVGITKLEVDAWYRSVILANPEVLELVFFESIFNRFSRQYDLEFVVRTKKGEERVTVGLRPDQEVTYVVPDQEQYLPPTTPSIKVMSAFISGTSEVSAILSKDAISFVSAPIAGVSTVTATAERLFQAVTITGTSSVSAGSGVKAMSATISGSGDVAAYISTVMEASIFASGAMSASITKVLASTIAGVSTTTAVISKDLSATISGSADITAAVSYGGGTLITGTSSVTAVVSKVMAATIAGTSLVSAGGAYSMVATIASSGAISASIAKPSSATIAGTSAVTSTARKVFTATISGTSTTSAVVVKPLSATITSTHNITASIQKGGSVVITGTSTLSGNIQKVKYTSANITSTSGVTANFFKVNQLSATVSGSSTTTATGLRLLLPTTLTGSGNVVATARKAMSSTITGSGNIAANITTVMSATISGTSTTTGTITKEFFLSAAITGNSGTVLPGTVIYTTAGDSLTSYDSMILASQYQATDYWKFHEDYTGNTGSASTRPLVNALREAPAQAAGNYSSTARPTYASTPLQVYASSKSIKGTSLGIDASTAYKVVPDNNRNSGKMSVSFWIRTPATLSAQTILYAYNNGGGYYWTFSIDASGRMYVRGYDYNGEANFYECYTSTGSLVANTTYHVVYVFNPTVAGPAFQMNLYLNTSQRTLTRNLGTYSFNFPTYTGTSLDTLEIGNDWQGNIECLSIHSYLFNSTEVQTLYNLGTTGNP